LTIAANGSDGVAVAGIAVAVAVAGAGTVDCEASTAGWLGAAPGGDSTVGTNVGGAS